MIRCARCGMPVMAGVCLAAALCALPVGAQDTAQVATPNAAPSGSPAAGAEGDSLLQRAQSDVDAKDFAAAAEKYKAYLAAHPDDPQIHFQLGYCDTALGQSEAARAQYEKATQLDPTLAPAFLNLGLTLIEEGSIEAVAPLKRAAELMPGDAKPRILLAAALSIAGQTDEALAQFADLEKDNDRDEMLHREFGEALLRARRYGDAEREFRTALAIDGEDADTHWDLAMVLQTEEKYDEAVEEYATYLKAHPESTSARVNQSDALIFLGRLDEGVAELQRAVKPGGVGELLMQVYQELLAAKRSDDAVALLLKAEQVDPQNPRVHFALADTFASRKAYSEAAREFQAVMKMSPDNANALAGWSSMAYAGKDYSTALAALALLERKQPLPPAALFARADCYDKLGKKAEALEAYEKFLAANTDQNSDMYFAAAARARSLKRELGKK